jgi:hypothetical protein
MGRWRGEWVGEGRGEGGNGWGDVRGCRCCAERRMTSVMTSVKNAVEIRGHTTPEEGWRVPVRAGDRNRCRLTGFRYHRGRNVLFFSSRIHGQGRDVRKPARRPHVLRDGKTPRDFLCHAPLGFCVGCTPPPPPPPPIPPVTPRYTATSRCTVTAAKEAGKRYRTQRDESELGRCRRGVERRQGRGQGRWYREYVLQYVELSSPSFRQRSHSGKGASFVSARRKVEGVGQKKRIRKMAHSLHAIPTLFRTVGNNTHASSSWKGTPTSGLPHMPWKGSRHHLERKGAPPASSPTP